MTRASQKIIGKNGGIAGNFKGNRSVGGTHRISGSILLVA